MQLREYQSKSIKMLYAWMEKNQGHPCVVMPTGSGKSHVIAALCKNALQNWPETRILMLSHVKELIVQNAEKMREHWPNAPLGIYSAGIGKRQLGEPITFAGIQSVRDKAMSKYVFASSCEDVLACVRNWSKAMSQTNIWQLDPQSLQLDPFLLRGLYVCSQTQPHTHLITNTDAKVLTRYFFQILPYTSSPRNPVNTWFRHAPMHYPPTLTTT